MSYYSEEYLDQGHALTQEVKVDKDPMPISFPVLKNEPEDRTFLDQLVTGSKQEYVNQSHELTSEIKVEDPVAISFPVVKREPEEEQTDSDTVNEEPRIELTAEDNEVLMERIAATNERTVSRELAILPLEENGIPRKSGSSGKPVRTREDGKQLELQLSKICASTAKNMSSHSSMDVSKKPFNCEVSAMSFSNSKSLRTNESLHTGEKRFKCDVCGRCFFLSGDLKKHELVHSGEKPLNCKFCGKCFSLKTNLKTHERLHTGETPL
ncbi:zinc finger protein 587B-like [Periplaneta americana]|uniref:zinc finger protein 587B-like n=1 Tax=Periplaneta americana TaxID=6978 RepID=UPI0037E9C93D